MACSIDPADPSLIASGVSGIIETARNEENDIPTSSKKKRSIITSTTVAASTALLLCCNCQPIPRQETSSSLPSGLGMSSSSSASSNSDSSNRNNASTVNSNVHCYLCEKSVHSTAKHCRYCDKCVKGFDHHW